MRRATELTLLSDTLKVEGTKFVAQARAADLGRIEQKDPTAKWVVRFFMGILVEAAQAQGRRRIKINGESA